MAEVAVAPLPPRRRLVIRVYGFAAILAIATMAALLVLPRYVRSPTFLEPQAALAQYLVERLSHKDATQFAEMVARLEPRLRGKLTLRDVSGKVLSSTETPPLPAPDGDELATLRDERWSLAWDRIVVRSDDGSVIGVYVPNRPPFPWGYVLPLGAIILLFVGAASVWFARRLARPLDQLAEAARQFGAGDTAARARLRRGDELGDVGRAFDDMADRTAGVLDAQRQLMADVSHELRTPLARIRVALELAAEDPVAAGDVLTDVGEDLAEIDQLIADILTTSRLDGSYAAITRQPTELGELAGRAAARFAARHPGRVLEQTVAAPTAEVACDPMLLRRALDNLLDNAAKYSDAKDAVRLDATLDGDKIAFAVVDRGIGMSEDDLGRAFTPFWRADSSRARKTGGVGLGLALARRIARAHGGDVTLASKVGEGTTARLEVPVGLQASTGAGPGGVRRRVRVRVRVGAAR